MSEEQKQEHVGRRRLLRGAGAVVAGVAGAGVAGAVAATPAQATDDLPILQGQINTGTKETTIELSGTDPTPLAPLRLKNANGPALVVNPVGVQVPSTIAPEGSVFVDTWGDITTVGKPGSTSFILPMYSPTWATMTIPIDPIRVVDSRDSGNRDKFIGALFDSAGRVIPRYDPQGAPDALVNLSHLAPFAYAVQFNLTIDKATKGGFIGCWGGGPWPKTSSLNFTTLFAISNFVQSTLGTDPDSGIDSAFSLVLSQPAAVIVDVVGFIVADPVTDLTLPGSVRGARAEAKPAPRRSERRALVQPK